jgi:hypothetical protein
MWLQGVIQRTYISLVEKSNEEKTVPAPWLTVQVIRNYPALVPRSKSTLAIERGELY